MKLFLVFCFLNSIVYANTKSMSAAEVITSDSDFSTLTKLLKKADLVKPFVKKGQNLSIFGPTNEAFAKLPCGAVPALIADLELLRDILKFHVVPQKIGQKSGVKFPFTLNGDQLRVEFQKNSLYADSGFLKSVQGIEVKDYFYFDNNNALAAKIESVLLNNRLESKVINAAKKFCLE